MGGRMHAMRLIGLAALVALTGCTLHENERVNVAGIEFRGLAWAVECGATTQTQLNGRLRRQFSAIAAAELTEPSPRENGGLYYAQAIGDHDRASRELAACPVKGLAP